jgi:LPS export ABC transporter protein LptC
MPKNNFTVRGLACTCSDLLKKRHAGTSPARYLWYEYRLSISFSRNAMKFIAHLFLVLLVTAACTKSEMKELQTYEGPLREIDNMELLYTEGGAVKATMKAAQVFEFANGDREFPKGIYMEFYDAFGQLESTLRADHAFFFKEENKWRGRGDVVVKNVLKNEQLNTEELFWKPSDQRIYTDKFVTIRQQTDVIAGEGMEAKQDLSDFEMKKVTGEFDVQDEEEQP